MNRLPSILVVVGLAAPLRAQASPGLLSPSQKSPTFQIALPPFSSCGTSFDTVSCQKLSADPPGVYTICLTMKGLTSTYGGNGRRLGVLLGKYDLGTRAFTATTEANLFNNVAYHHYNFHVEPALGLIAVCERQSAASGQALGVMLSVRASTKVPFPAAAPVAGIQGTIGDRFDGAVGRIGGVPQLFYMATIGGQQGIWVDALDLTTPTQPRVIGQPKLVVANRPAWERVHSPTPLAGPDGDVEGLWCGRRVNNLVQNTFVEDLDPTTEPLLTIAGVSSMVYGGIAGGTILCVDDAWVYSALTETKACWLLGDDAARGGVANFVAGAAGGTTTQPVVTVLFLAAGVASPTRIPGFLGAIGISLSPLVVLGASVHDANELATWAMPIPDQSALAGLRLAVQGLSIVTAKPGTFVFTNSAWLRIR